MKWQRKQSRKDQRFTREYNTWDHGPQSYSMEDVRDIEVRLLRIVKNVGDFKPTNPFV